MAEEDEEDEELEDSDEPIDDDEEVGDTDEPETEEDLDEDIDDDPDEYDEAEAEPVNEGGTPYATRYGVAAHFTSLSSQVGSQGPILPSEISWQMLLVVEISYPPSSYGIVGLNHAVILLF